MEASGYLNYQGPTLSEKERQEFNRYNVGRIQKSNWMRQEEKNPCLCRESRSERQEKWVAEEVTYCKTLWHIYVIYCCSVSES